MSRKRLGRGLDALLSGSGGDQGPADVPASAQSEIAIDDVVRSRYQPRREFSEERLAELAASIKAQGLMQPIVVRPRAQGGFELIAGERRWRAARLAGLTRLPAVVKEVSDEQASAMALIENIQREDLNPVEEAFALQRLRDEFELTQQQVADAVGKSRVAVTNLLRLLNLTPPVRELLERGALEMGHARALLALEGLDQERLAREVADKQLSVRQTEQLVRQRQQQRERRGGGAERREGKDPDTRRLEQRLSDRIGAPVSINHGSGGRGQLVISYSSLDELDGILKHLR
ncbi:MAG: chromosome partitioning protein ParB [Gammaproteobacteria bacterium]|nr:chromosome partitioning protein ParB [Gammaproteobacteria bacterium]